LFTVPTAGFRLDILLRILQNTGFPVFQEPSLTTARAKITALGTYVPPRVLSNADLEKMVDTTNEWILDRVGIRERHIADKGVAASDLAVAAVKNMLESQPFDLQEVDLIVVGTVTPDMMYPSTACLVQHKLGIENTWGFDVSAGCSGFVYALNTGVKFVESGQYKKVLVIGADVNSSMTDYTDRAVCIIFGDGAGAVLLEPSADGEGVIDHVAQVEGMGGQYLFMPGGGSLNPASHETVDQKMHYIHQDGKNVFKYAVKKMAEMTERVLERNKLTGKDVDCFIAHQANRRIITATADRLGMPSGKVIINIDRFGNTTAGTIPLAMNTAIEEGKLKRGDLLLIAAVGAGFTSGATLLRWAF
jgi:3-oxoacyl-[acyl-carrier-protein] synthase III